MSSRQPVLSIDVGGGSCKFGLVEPDGTVDQYQEIPTDRAREKGVEGFLEDLRELREDQALSGVVMAVPATVDWDHNHVRGDCPELPWIEDSANKKQLQSTLGLPVLMVNDVEATLVGEWRRGELKGMDSGVVLSLGRSMGSALLWNGRPQQGRRGSIMELEQVSLETHGEPWGEAPAGASSQWLSGRGLADQIDSAGLDLEVPTLFESEEGEAIRQEFVQRLAHLLGTVTLMLDPERLVLTGGLTRSSDRWLDDVTSSLDDYITEQFSGLPSVTLGRLRDQDVLKGPAAFWWWNQEDSV